MIRLYKKRRGPIIKSLLDVDFYEFTMGQWFFRNYPDVSGTFRFNCRTIGADLGRVIGIDDLRREFSAAQKLIPDRTELHYLRGTNEYGNRMFNEEYLDFYSRFQLSPPKVEQQGNDLLLEFSGPWIRSSYWETMALPIVNQLYYEALMKDRSEFQRDQILAEGVARLAHKIELIRQRPSVTIADFGTRRRFSFEWQEYVVRTLATELPGQFRGTSNTYLAKKHGLMPVGTNAHKMQMLVAALDGANGNDLALRASVIKTLELWERMYGYGLSIALTDTFGTDSFLKDFEHFASSWKGVRHDSGDPFAFGERVIAYYQGLGIDPRQKLLVFSDGLDIDTILKLDDQFRGRIGYTFGWGTTLTNDLGFDTLSMVIKPASVEGYDTVKLSDNLAKAAGPVAEVERYKRVFGYSRTDRVECKV